MHALPPLTHHRVEVTLSLTRQHGSSDLGHERRAHVSVLVRWSLPPIFVRECEEIEMGGVFGDGGVW
ncbi:hypothetical protein E2C01_053976 [Portunus trituberculatus]|uniref:Uncharacterized protein n=1 Tax=Portunus trituberculatus TaxID=210409 RepID=A0A5B7GQQ4_PORTR|nr:hypothetical protein [Portunus trituberculatus]